MTKLNSVVKFLIIRFSSIGDIVLTTPVVRNIKQQVEGATIHYLTKKQYTAIVQSNPYIDKVHTLDSDFSQIIAKLVDEHYDVIIDLHHNLRTARIKRKIGLPVFSFNKLNWEKWLIVNFKKNKLPDHHIVDRYMKTVDVYDVKNDMKGLDFFIPEIDEVDLTKLPEKVKNGYIGLVIGAQHSTKKMPLEKLKELCSKLEFPAIVLGGKEDSKEGEILEKEFPDKIYNAAGKYNLNQSASLVKQAKLIISHDTGLMHIAAAFKKQIFSVWGNTIPGFGMYPYLAGDKSKIFEVKELKCRPCSKIGFQKCPKKHFKCMMEQDIDFIVEKAKETI